MENKNILDKAKEAVEDREKKYGNPIHHFEDVAASWNGYGVRIVDKHRGGFREMTASDFANLMIHLKIAREKFKHSEDNLTDIAGYTLCKKRIEEYVGLPFVS